MNYKHIILFILAGLLWSSCNIINPAEKVPTYLYIDTFSFTPRGNTGGSSTNITSAWVYYDDNPVGVFDLPATVPILATGHGTIQIAPGVPIDGVYSLMSQYPFYSFDTGSFDASPGHIIYHHPVTQYVTTGTDAIFPWKEGFEGENSFLYGDGGDSIKAISTSYPIPNYNGTTNSKVFEGIGAGLISLSNPGDSSENISQQQYTINPGAAFCELNFNSTMPFYIGLIPVYNGTPLLTAPYYVAGVNPNGGGKWTKIYISLADLVAQYATLTGMTYNIAVKATLPSNQANGFVLLDDMKLVMRPQ